MFIELSLLLLLTAGLPLQEAEAVWEVPAGCTLLEGSVRFSANGATVAYVVQRDKKQVLIVNQVLGAEWDEVLPPVMDARGNHVAVRASKRTSSDDEWNLIYDEKVVATGDWIGEVVLSPADGTPCYWMSRRSPVLRFGKKKSTQWQIGLDDLAPSMSADGMRVATIGTKGGETNVLVFDSTGKEDKRGSGFVVDAVLRSDGKEMAYTLVDLSEGMPKEDQFHRFAVHVESLVAKGSKALRGLTMDYPSAANPVYSPSGDRLALKVLSGTRMGVGFLGEEPPKCTFDFVDELNFSADGSRLAYVACDGCKLSEKNGWEITRGVRATGGTWCLVVDGVRTGAYQSARLPTISPDGSAVAVAARSEDRWHVVCGKKSSGPCDAVESIVWAADGRSVWYGAVDGSKLRWTSLAVE